MRVPSLQVSTSESLPMSSLLDWMAFNHTPALPLQMPALQEGRGGHQLLACGSEIWALGGWDGRSFLSSVEVLDIRAGSWRPITPMQSGRAYFGAQSLDGIVYTIGGMGSPTVRFPFLALELQQMSLLLESWLIS